MIENIEDCLELVTGLVPARATFQLESGDVGI